MAEHRIHGMIFAKVYPMYVKKAQAKKRTQKEVDQIICWLTGYTPAGLQKQLDAERDPLVHSWISAVLDEIKEASSHPATQP